MTPDILNTLRLIKEDVDSRITYRSEGEFAALPDWTWVTPDSRGYGDCSVFTETYWRECEDAGLKPVRKVCKVWQNGWVQHAYCNVGEWAMDCRFPNKVILEKDGGYEEIV